MKEYLGFESTLALGVPWFGAILQALLANLGLWHLQTVLTTAYQKLKRPKPLVSTTLVATTSVGSFDPLLNIDSV